MKYVVVAAPDGAEGRHLLVTKDGNKAEAQYKRFRSGGFGSKALLQASFDGWHVAGTKIGQGEIYFVAVCSSEEEAERCMSDHASQSNIDIAQYSIAEADDDQINETMDGLVWDDSYADAIKQCSETVDRLEELMNAKPSDLVLTSTQRRYIDAIIDRLKTVHNKQLNGY